MENFAKKIIYKNNLIHNFKTLKQISNKKIICVVKADAYGHGIENIVNLLGDRCDFFATENLDEAIRLRKVNQNVRVLILGKCSNFKLAIENNIDITVDCVNELIKLLEVESQNINIHIKINCGMNRLGVKSEKELKMMLKILEKHKNINFVGLSTHFSCLKDENWTLFQINRFFKYIKLTKKYNPIIHVGGSGFVYYKNCDFVDYVRCGLMLYGYGDERLKPVMKIKAPVVKIVKVKKGEYVGYDNSYIAEADETIGIIPLGYADGIKKSMENQFYVSFKNGIAKQVGKICMDMFMVKLSDRIFEGDECVVFDDAHIWARKQNTIEYEILTNLISMRANYIVI